MSLRNFIENHVVDEIAGGGERERLLRRQAPTRNLIQRKIVDKVVGGGIFSSAVIKTRQHD